MEEGRRRPTLSHQMSVVDRSNSNLRNFLKLPDEDEKENEQQGSQPGNEISAVRSSIQPNPSVETTFPPGRTLLDIIRDEESSSAVAYKGMIARGGAAHRINWKSFKDRLRIRRTGAAWSSAGPSLSVSEEFEGSFREGSTAQVSPRVENTCGGAIVEEYDATATPMAAEHNAGVADPAQAVVVEEVDPPPVRISLMALLEQADSHVGSIDSDDGGYEEGVDGEDEEEEGGAYNCCCVCMVRHKGAAFIPCGHTFCRLCSRELWVSRGNCPLCNGYILEILDIF